MFLAGYTHLKLIIMAEEKLKKMLRLIVMLIGNHSLDNKALAVRLEICPRTVSRYIDTLRDAGFVTKSEGDIVRLETSSKLFRDISELIHFTPEEACILKAAIESIPDSNVMKQNLKKKLYTVYNYKVLAEQIVRPKNAAVVKTLVEALEQKKQVILHHYASAHGNTVSNRLVEPFEFTTNYIQIWCFEIESQANKLFKIERMERVELLKHEYMFQDQHRSGCLDIFRMHSFHPVQLQLKLNVRAASLLQEEYPLAEKYLTPIGPGEWLLDTKVCGFEGVGRFVLGLMNDIEVIKPKKFITWLKDQTVLARKKLKK